MARDAWPVRAFARLLPRDFRERVFEPALADFRLDARLRPHAFARLAAGFVLAIECIRLASPQLMWRRGRPTRFAWAVVGVLLVLIVRLRMNYRWVDDRPTTTAQRSR